MAMRDGSSADGEVSFRPLTRADFPDLVMWFCEPHITAVWTDPQQTLDAVEAKYGPRVDGRSATACFVALLDGRPVGMVHAYRVRDYPEYAGVVGHADGVGVDYFLGDPTVLGAGLGSRMLERFIASVVPQSYPGATCVVSSPSIHNPRSIRVLEKIEFIAQGVVDVPGEIDPEMVMVRALDA